MLRPIMILFVGACLTTSMACQKEKASDDKNDKPGAGKKATGEMPKDGLKINGKPTKRPNTAIKRPTRKEVPAPDDVKAAPADATKTASGLAYKVIKTSDDAGDKPGINDQVQLVFSGWSPDGKMVETSTFKRSPHQVLVNKTIPGQAEALQLMRKGETWRLWIPEELAYKGQAGRPQGPLTYDIELQDIKKAPPVPEDVAAAPKKAKKTKIGVFYKVLNRGNTKEKPRSWDRVSVHYSGWTTNGLMFDSSVIRGKPSSFGVSGVIAGWTDALQGMNTGDKWRVWIPEEHAYKGKKGRPAGMLVFDVELIEIERLPEPPKPIPAPKDVAGPPKDAKKTDAGVFIKTLKAGTGEKPVAASKVKVHYTGWKTDGKMFDSSVMRGEPISFGLGRVIPGWRDGLQQMKVGETARLWIPEAMAYGGKREPKGMLVFDVELLAIEK